MTDPIADVLVRLMNAGRARKELVSIPHSDLKERILELLMRAGLLTSVMRRGRKSKKRLEVALGYDENKHSSIQGARRLSRPGRRLYLKASDVRTPKDGRGFLILSTPHGVLTHREAKTKKVGGEALFEIW